MKIGILTTYPGILSRKINEEALKRGHDSRIIITKDIKCTIEGNSYQIYSNGEDLSKLDVILVRGLTKERNHKTILHFLEKAGVRIVDTKLANSYDNSSKVDTAFTLANAGFSVPKSLYFSNLSDISFAKITECFGEGKPVIAKISVSSQGRGVFKLENEQDYKEFVKGLKEAQKKEILFQEYIEHEGDYRIFVIGDKVIGAIYRRKVGTDFRSNVAQGAVPEKAEISEEIAKTAIAAKNAVGLEIAGVDMIIKDNQYWILEINWAPQFMGFTTATGINIPEKLVMYLEESTNGK